MAAGDANTAGDDAHKHLRCMQAAAPCSPPAAAPRTPSPCPQPPLVIGEKNRSRPDREGRGGGGGEGEGSEELNDAGRMLRATCHTVTACTLRLDIVRVTRKVRGVGVHGVEPSNIGGQAVEVVAAGPCMCVGKGREIARVVALQKRQLTPALTRTRQN